MAVDPRSKEKRAANARQTKLNRAGKPIPSTVKHGLESTYGNWGCRCDPCLDVGRTARNARRVRADLKARGVEEMLFVGGPFADQERERPLGEKKMLVKEFKGLRGAATGEGDVPLRSHLYERVEVMLYRGPLED